MEKIDLLGKILSLFSKPTSFLALAPSGDHTLKLRPIFKKSDHLLKVVPMDSYGSSDTRKVVFEIGKTPAHGQNWILIFFH